MNMEKLLRGQNRKNMQFRDLKKQYQILKKDIDQAIVSVLNEGNYILGKQVEELEESLAEYVGVKHCITCGNGTDALTMALMTLDIKEGDAIFVPNFTFFATAEAVSFSGATPIFVDVDEETFNLDPKKLEIVIKNVLSERRFIPKAIIAVDLFGLPADYVNIKKVADRYNLKIIEDGAQGFGGSINGKRACSFGDISTTSFFPAKPLGCYGDGGAIFTDNDAYAEYLKSIQVHGKNGADKYDNVRIGMNSRLDTLQAAILQVKLKAFIDYELEAVNKVASWYDQRLREIVDVPTIPEGFYSSWAQYTIKLKSKKQRDELQAKLKDTEIPTMIYYPKTMSEQTAYKDLDVKNANLSISEKLSKTVLSLPMHPYFMGEEIEIVCAKIKKCDLT
ncbi:MAG: DegT/DnrJ/EryC1/StrS family aminotransferase [Lactobacillales bacterium]|nr:DegT/DnrJ/EryC1/StrS family aminotransferase [Lactobacillales bacterium]